MSGAVVELDAVTRRFAAGGDGFALGPLSLAVEAGSFLVVSGPSGSGKTTLLSLLAGLDRADAGRVRLFGVDVDGASESALARLRREHVGVAPQRIALLDHLPLWQNVTCSLVPTGVSARERRALARRALERLELGGMDERLPRELSGGEQQRAVLARALVREPKLVLADEPTSNVDARTAARIAELLANLRMNGVTVVVASHDRALEERADRRLELARGRWAGSPA